MDGLTLFGGSKKRRRDEVSHGDSADQGVVVANAFTTASSAVPHSSEHRNGSNSSKSRAGQSSATLSSSALAAGSLAANIKSFTDFGLSSWLVKSVNAMSIRVPTPIQAGAIPHILAGCDVIGCAQTGTGKTAAFALPVLHRLNEDPYGIFALVLTPSRELAFQISEQFNAFGAAMGFRVVTATGGTDIINQSTALASKPHVVVATPGRLAYQILQSATPPDLSRLAFLVLDECDRLLEPSFRPDLDVILKAASSTVEGSENQGPITRQTLLFSATVTQHVRSKETMKRLGVRVDKLHLVDTSGAASMSGVELSTFLGSVAAASSSAAADSRGSGKKKSQRKSATADEDDDSDDADGDDDDGDNSVDGAGATGSSVPSSAMGTDAFLSPLTASNLRQEYLFIPAAVKDAYLWQLLLSLGPSNLSIDSQQQQHGGKSGRGSGPSKAGKGAPSSGGGGAGSGSGKNAKAGGKHAYDVTSGKEALGSAGAAAAAAAEEESRRAKSIIIFCSSCRGAQLVSETCIELGIPTTALHSAMPQQKRLASLAKFKGGVVRLLVATDVASRGLDIPSVDLVINHDVPRVPSDYVHRVGRTARAGRGGRAVTIVTQFEISLIHAIEASVLRGKKLEALATHICPEDAVLQRMVKVAAARHLAKQRLQDTGFEDTIKIRKARKDEARKEREEMGR